MFLNKGKIVQPVYLKRIEDGRGNVIAEFEKKISDKPVISEETANIMRHILQNIVNRGTATGLRSQFGLYGEMGGKTGTTQSNTDGWFIGFTPDIIACAWVGGSYPQIRFRTSLGQGALTALPIWGSFFYQLYKDPLYKSLAYSSFPETGDYTETLLDCPDYKEDESLFDFLFEKRRKPEFEKEERENRILRRIKEIFGGKNKNK